MLYNIFFEGIGLLFQKKLRRVLYATVYYYDFLNSTLFHSATAATPGRVLPSIASRSAPPPVDT